MSDNTLPCEQYFFTPDKNHLLSSAVYISWAGRRVCDETHEIGPRVLDTYKLVIVLSGQGYLSQDDHETITLKANDIFILFANHKHHYWADPDDPWVITWVAFNGADSSNLLSAVHVTLDNYVVKDVLTDSIRSSMTKLIQALADETDVYRLSAVSTLFSVFNKLRMNLKNIPSKPENDEEPLVPRIATFIEQNYFMEIDMNMICDNIHYSRSYLSRVFKSEKGITIKEFLRDIRIGKAKNLLSGTSLSVQEVAKSVGIIDSLYFSRIFRQQTGYSPSEYRQLLASRE